MADILSRLPAKSIVKFRCVCKESLLMTTDPRFLKSHHRSSSYMVIDKYVVDGKIKSYDFNIGDGKDSTKSSYTLNFGRRVYYLSNFVDGLTCAYGGATNSDIYLLNPTTRELQKLPKKNNNRQEVLTRESSIFESVGLGIDMSMGQYKIVRLFTSSESHRLQCEIFNVGTAQWRCLGEAPFEFANDSCQFLHHGALYWTAYHQQAGNIGLFRFDIKDEKFGSMIPIPYPSPSLMSYCSFKESRGKLWLTFMNHSRGYYEIWTMKEYLNSTWVKEYKFDGSTLPSLYNYIYIAGNVDSDFILKSCDEQLKRHDIRYNPCSEVFHKLLDGESTRDILVYKESLISPKKLLMVSPKDV